jgi:hypothetical protein
MTALEALLAQIEHDPALLQPGELRQRSEALDRLEAWLPADADAMPEHPSARRAWMLRQRLQAIDDALFRELRRQVRCGAGVQALRPWLHAGAGGSDAERCRGGDSYDHLDTLVSGLLRLQPPEREVAPPPAGMVFYQPTPARHIFDLLLRAGLGENDVLVDLGSGLGHVPMLAAMATAARGIGVEREAAYVACARQAARALGLRDVHFVVQDARDADLATGTLFYLYTPFRGAVLRTVLDALRSQATRRSIRVASYGPCTAAIAAEAWLEPLDPATADRIALFRSRTVGEA